MFDEMEAQVEKVATELDAIYARMVDGEQRLKNEQSRQVLVRAREEFNKNRQKFASVVKEAMAKQHQRSQAVQARAATLQKNVGEKRKALAAAAAAAASAVPKPKEPPKVDPTLGPLLRKELLERFAKPAAPEHGASAAALRTAWQDWAEWGQAGRN